MRGEDHVTNTAAQIEIFQALGAPVPPSRISRCWWARAARRCPSGWVRCRWNSLREDGIEPMAVASYLAKIGTSDPVEPRLSLDELAQEFDFAKIGRAPAHFDAGRTGGAERQAAAHHCPTTRWPRACRRWASAKRFWDAIKAQSDQAVAMPTDLARLVTGPVTPVIEDAGLAAKAAALLPPEPWDEDTWGAWTKAVAAETGAKGRGLFHPLAAGADRAGAWTRTQKTVTPDRARPSSGAA